MKMKKIIFLFASVIWFLLLIQSNTVYALFTNADIPQALNDTKQAKTDLNRVANIMNACANMASNYDYSGMEVCMTFVRQFHSHMQQLFAEEQDNVTKILLVG